MKRFLDKVSNERPTDARDLLLNYGRNYRRLLDEEAPAQMAQQFWSWIAQRRLGEGGLAFLLFGCSETVASVLCSSGRQERPLTLFIAEGRPKSQYGAHNTPTYVDGQRYASLVRAKEKANKQRPSTILLIPDACVATSIKRGQMDLNRDDFPRVDAILFGTNGIYSRRPGIAHSVGHLGVSLVGRALDVPVVAIGCSAKIGDEPTQGWATVQRGNEWIASPRVIDESLKRLDVERDWNPREEHVELENLTALITDQGTLADLEEGEARRRLLDWSADVDARLTGDSRPSRGAE